MIQTILFSQKNEYQYIALRFGASHGFTPAPGWHINKFANTEFGDLHLSPDGSAYVPGFVFDFYYHFDFTTDNAGIYVGLEYNYSGLGAKYVADRNTTFTLKEIDRFHAIGVPIAFKYGPDIWKTQRYFFAGAQLNYIIAMNQVSSPSWNSTPSSVKITPDEYNKTAFNLFLGFNYAAFNLQFDYYPKSIFNKKYLDEDRFYPYNTMPDQVFLLKTSVNIPYRWLSEKSFWWRKKLRKTFWR